MQPVILLCHIDFSFAIVSYFREFCAFVAGLFLSSFNNFARIAVFICFILVLYVCSLLDFH